ncbi:MAG: hypothetical protein K2Y14_08445 [Burkholderiales bacterium]|nr:hypothetical protein [Burkholderiales bacterium]
MRKLVVILLISGVSSSFASSVVAQAAESEAMTKCLSTKTQLECNALQSAGTKAVAKAATAQTAQ